MTLTRTPRESARKLGTLRLDGDEVRSASDALSRMLAAAIYELRHERYAERGAVVTVTIEGPK